MRDGRAGTGDRLQTPWVPCVRLAASMHARDDSERERGFSACFQNTAHNPTRRARYFLPSRIVATAGHPLHQRTRSAAGASAGPDAAVTWVAARYAHVATRSEKSAIVSGPSVSTRGRFRHGEGRGLRRSSERDDPSTASKRGESLEKTLVLARLSACFAMLR